MSESKMSPMQLKEPAACCGTRALLWDRAKRYYMCPCGKLKVNENGRPVGKPFQFLKKASRA